MNVWLLVRGEAEFRREALEVLERLRGHVVKVDEVHHGVHDREEEGGARANLQRLFKKKGCAKKYHNETIRDNSLMGKATKTCSKSAMQITK